MGDLFIFDIPISIGTMLYQAFIFSVLLFVLHKLFFKKIIEILDNRKKLIVEQLEEVERYKESAKKKYEIQMEELEQAKIEARKVRDNSNKEAEFIIRNAKMEASKLRRDVYQDLKNMKGA